jgi:CheY-like chemotaxis protein/HAMP domain-containing protein
MKRLSFSSLRTNLTFWFLIIALVPLLAAMLIAYQQNRKAFEQESVNKLSAVRDLKVNQIEIWLKERKGDFRTFALNTDTKLLTQIVENSSDLHEDAKKQIRFLLHNYQKAYSVYEEIYIVNSKTGIVEISTNPANEGANKSSESYIIKAIQKDKIHIDPIYYSAEAGMNLLTMSAPLYQEWGANSNTIAVLVANISLENSLYPLMLMRNGMGKTGETLLINKDKLVLNELRWYEHAPLRLSINTEGVRNALDGKTGAIITLDYRGEKVVLAYTYLPETEWAFIAKQDWAELEKETKTMGNMFLMLFFISGLFIISVVYFVSKSISSPIILLSKDIRKIADGDFSVRNTVQSKDEIGQLAQAINRTVESIESRDKIRNGISVLSETLIGNADLKSYSEKMLRQLMKLSSAQMVVFYRLNDKLNLFELFDSIGANTNLIKPFQAERPAGEFGNAIANKEIYHLKNLPDDTQFKFLTSAGEIVPKEIISVPFLNNSGEVIGLVSLVKLEKFSPETIEVLQLSGNALSASYSILVAAEQTAKLAEKLALSNQKLEGQSEELQQQTEELRQQAEELLSSADELQLQNQELIAQRKQVEESSRLKSEFLSNMSHELRTPLNSINALSRVLSMQAKSRLTEEENNYLEVVERNGKRLLALINDILDLSKVESGKVELQPEKLNLFFVLSQVIESVQPLARQKNVELRCDSCNDKIEIETDKDRLHQVITNIVGNAVKFTDKGNVLISVSSDAHEVHIRVKDTGIGISKEMLPFIFDEFRQADGSISRSYEGTGLGLAIAKKLVKILKGSISVESIQGQGSVFTITLPTKWKGEEAIENAGLTIDSISEEFNKRILVVDDDLNEANKIANSLKLYGFQVSISNSGKEALAFAEKYKPFAITLDLIMPEMDGFEVLQKLKSNPKTANIPVIVISVSDDRQTSFALGSVGYLSKPIDPRSLLAEIYRLNVGAVTTVMVVDDNPIDRKMVHDMLELENIRSVLVESGQQCLEMLSHRLPDILILDLMMPEMSGFEVLNQIRNNPKTTDLPVIIVTSKDLTSSDKQKLTGNAMNVLSKSGLTPQKLLFDINRIFRALKNKIETENAYQQENTSKRVLLVEDNEIAVIQIQKVLEQEGIQVDVAANGKQAIDYIKQIIPNGIILDLMMPEMDGFGVLESIRSTNKTKKLPVMILTAKNLTKSDLTRLSFNNVFQLLQKGDIDSESLLNTVRAMLRIQIELPTKLEEKASIENASFENQRTETNKQNAEQRILSIEDNFDNRLTVSAIVKGKYTLLEAVDGEEGLQKAIEELPDLILLDLSLPKMGGIEVVKELKLNPKTQAIPVIALTSRAMKNDKEEILEAGFDDYIAKPIDPETLLSRIEKWLNPKNIKG